MIPAVLRCPISICVATALSTLVPPGHSAKAFTGKRPSYFPVGVLSPFRRSHDRFLREWYGKHLFAMGELPVRSLPSGEVYRFTWLRTRHHPISIRVEKVGSSISLHAIELDGLGGYEPGTKLRELSITLSPQQWVELQVELESAKFWDIRSDETRPGLDGSQWILEGRIQSTYHVVDRWSPDGGEYRALCLHFLKIAGWTIPQDEIY